MKKILAPFTLFKHEKAYCLWIFSVFLAIIISLIFLGCKSFFSNGQGIIFVIALLVPFFPELLVPFITEKKKKNTPKYVTYKIVSVIICLFLIVSLFCILLTIEKISIFWQLMSFFVSLIFVVYLYTVTKMDTHQDCFGFFDDIPYGVEENEKVSELLKNANSREKVGDVCL